MMARECQIRVNLHQVLSLAKVIQVIIDHFLFRTFVIADFDSNLVRNLFLEQTYLELQAVRDFKLVQG